MSVDRIIALFGTTEPLAAREIYTVGPLSFTFEDGGIRHIRFGEVEVIRGIQYLLRDANWATPEIEIGKVSVDCSPEAATLSFMGRVHSGSIEFDVESTIVADSSGELSFKVIGTSASHFAANRVGFTVLHPTPECQDIALDVEHLEADPEHTRFPLEISPSQPVLDIQVLSYSPAPNVKVHCELRSKLPDGRAGCFEMEDQRNWSDASFKTYVGSLLQPWPYDVMPGDRFEQTVTIQCTGTAPQVTSVTNKPTVQVEIGRASRAQVASIGLAVPDGGAVNALDHLLLLKCAGVHHLTAYVRAGANDLDSSLQELQHLASALSLGLNLEIELPCQVTPTDELDRVASACATVGLRPAAVLACPAAYLTSYQPSERWPDVPALGDIYAAARQAFPGSKIGGGMLSFFTELNRKWPPEDAIDYVTHSVSPIVHAADDATLMENLATIKAMAATVRARMGATEHRLGPSAISMRHNPYGSATLPNTEAKRIAMGDADPRERALFGAAWTLGLVASAFSAGVGHLTLFATSGPRSIAYQRSDHRQPWFDEAQDASVRPLFHVVRGLAALAGSETRNVELTGAGASGLAALAAGTAAQTELWLANLSDTKIEVELETMARFHTLDASTFEAACRDPNWLDNEAQRTGTTLTLDSYAVAHCRMAC